MFAITQCNGTTTCWSGWGLRMVRGKVVLIPRVLFAVAALSPRSARSPPPPWHCWCPVGMNFVFRNHRHSLMLGMVVICGAHARPGHRASPRHRA